jgi:ABC-2 type transport system permease protein
MNDAITRLRGLLRKEIRQVVRDPSSLLIAFLLPVVLLLVNGYGVSLDARLMRVAVVTQAPAEETRELVQAIAASPYLAPVAAASTVEGERMITAGSVRGMLVLPEDFSARLARPTRWRHRRN